MRSARGWAPWSNQSAVQARNTLPWSPGFGKRWDISAVASKSHTIWETILQHSNTVTPIVMRCSYCQHSHTLCTFYFDFFTFRFKQQCAACIAIMASCLMSSHAQTPLFRQGPCASTVSSRGAFVGTTLAPLVPEKWRCFEYIYIYIQFF